MKAIILAAGYGTRLAKSSKNTPYEKYLKDRPKGLIELGGQTIIDTLIKKVKKYVDEIRVITNQKYFRNFQAWHKGLKRGMKKKVFLINDGSTENENRKGTFLDLAIAAGYTDQLKIEQIKDSVLVLVSDRYANFDFKKMIKLSEERKASINVGFRLKDIKKAIKHGQLQVDSENRLQQFAEKADPPVSRFISTAFYLYTPEALGFIPEYIRASGNVDASGHFLEFLCKKLPVYIYEVEENPYDIGDLENYLEAKQMIEKKWLWR